MCGIAGLFRYGGGVEREKLERVNAVQRHRGPDDAGIYVDPSGRLGFAQCRLSIIDLSPAGHQPMVWTGPQGDVVLNFNGEIYNYRELRTECNAAAPTLLGHAIPWRGASDTEVLLWSYLLWGSAMLKLLDGMFALAIWDGRSRKLWLARDRFGVKPLYFSSTATEFAFASEIKGLLELSDCSREIDRLAVAQYVGFLYTPGERTMLKAVRKLGPGECLAIDGAGVVTPSRFATTMPLIEPDSSLTPEGAAKRVRELLAAAVQHQMVADVPVGAFLSGGLDSSSVVHFARQHVTRGRLQCFTIGDKNAATQREGWMEDLPFARRVAKHLDVDLHTIWVGPEIAEKFSWMIHQLDEPQADPAALNAYFIATLAREQGIKVLLSGAGGDDIFTGYRRHDALTREWMWSWLPQLGRSALKNGTARLPRTSPWGRRLAKAFQFADRNPHERLAGYFFWLHPDMIDECLSAEARGGAVGQEAMAVLLQELDRMPAEIHPINKMLYLDARYFLADHNLNYTDKMCMAASVEVRVPFLDPELVDFAATIPPGFKQHGAVGKWILKKAMEPYLPHDVIYRPKTGFGVPLRSWLQKELRDQVDDALAESTLKRRGLFNPVGVRKLVEMDRAGKIDATYSIFALMCIETWFRIFVDRR